MKRLYSYICRALCAGVLALGAAACSDEVNDDSYYTFTGDTVASYCGSSDDYSVFAQLLADTELSSLLSTYGHYTCFLPDNAAFERYFKTLGKSYADLTDAEKREIVYNHVIKSAATDYFSEHFEEGSLPESNMNDKYVTISYVSDAAGGGLTINVNKTSTIVEKDIEVHNGVIHIIDNVLTSSEEFLLNILEGSGDFTIFAEALRLTHLNDSTERIIDESYVCPYPSGEVRKGEMVFKVPVTKRYGYTLFAEPDDVMRQAGINSIDDLKAYATRYYGNEDATDYTSRDNALNRFVAYHILDRQMSTNSFIYNGACTSANFMTERKEYYETMYAYRLMEIKAGNKINTRRDGTYTGLTESKSNLSGVNGFVHSLSSMLVYDEDVMVNDVLNKRIRFDFYNVPPELTNNNIRWQLAGMADASGYVIPNDFCPKHLAFSDETEITMWASEGWTNFEADELKLNGWYDFTLRMLPVPPGSYEIRLGYRQESWRGIAQLFVDGEIQGIPRDLRIAGTDPQVGWVPDTGTPSDAENDKAMRNRGYMKAPASIWTLQGQTTLREKETCLRIIIGQFNFQEYGAHYLRGKNVYAPDQEFHGDYIEIIPTSLIDTEDIY
ncbi:MAG: fasciclin domain-containing protein [Duncaniella sp.]|nr:fasciclin domain-containing protein [Duncaniella sp.]